MDAAFRSLVDTIIRNSRLSVSLLRISNVTEDSFNASLEVRITRTGLASATIAPLTADLCGPWGRFGSVTLPAITTQAYGTDIVVTDHMVKIVDKEALKTFIQAIIRDGTVTLSLRNGRTAVSAMGFGPRDIIYEKEVALPGMNGPAVSLRAASIAQNNATAAAAAESPATAGNPAAANISSAAKPDAGGGDSICITIQVANPSPLEITFGTCSFDIQDHEGRVIAELTGRLDIRRDRFEVTVLGDVNKAVVAKLAADMREAAGGKAENEKTVRKFPEARLIGKRCGGAGWCDETVKSLNVPLRDVQKLFHALGLDDGVEEQPKNNNGNNNRDGGFMKWTQKLMTL